MKKGKLVQKKAQVHIRLVNPNAARRIILESALDSANLIKDVAAIHAIREKKYKTIKQFGRVLREIKAIERQLSVAHMPEVNDTMGLEVHHNKVSEVKPEPKHHEHKEVKKPAHKTEADKLKDELREIESKLKSLQ